MSDPRDDPPYEPPAIEDRTKVDTPLIGAGSPGPCLPTAVFRPATDDYEAPAIEEREAIDTPLVAIVPSGEPTSAAFHPPDAYEPPAIVERDEIDTPLVAVTSGGTCLATH